MAEQAVLKIRGLRTRWIAYRLLADVCLSISVALIAGSFLIYLFNISAIWAVMIMFATLAILLVLHRPWVVTNEKITGFLNQEYPELQESSELILQPATQLNSLQQLARSNTAKVLTTLKVSHKHFTKQIRWAFIWLCVGILVLSALNKWYIATKNAYINNRNAAICSSTNNQHEKILPQVEDIGITITPPTYTKKAIRRQNKFSFVTEEGAMVSWDIKTNVAVKNIKMFFNNKEEVVLKNAGGSVRWKTVKTITEPGFYQLNIDGKLSDLYQIDIIKDGPPVIRVRSPKQYTYIDAGQAQSVIIDASLNDDYGINNAMIMATVAKGRGEGVKFKEYSINFNTGFGSNNKQYNVQKLIELPALNMEPGDELYFYIRAQDTRLQLSRTDVFTVSIQDTAELLSMDGVLSGASLKPEFFRSERQIIIDAERLIRDKDTLTAEKFNSRSNDLGVDQKLLRLRYGKFLGEENEESEGGHNTGETASPQDFGNGAKILKEYTDDHDKAEDGQFFEPAIKAQLKATLSEMWKAELQLRLYRPQAALPFAYKALRLLKDLQQKSRSYVAKTSYNPPALKLEKRLSGELDKILQPVNKQEIKPPADRYAVLKNAVVVLEGLKLKPVLTTADKPALQLANQQLSTIASAQPGIYLPSLRAMRRILTAKRINITDMETVEKAIQQTLSSVVNLPQTGQTSPDMGLSRQYYKNLKPYNR